MERLGKILARLSLGGPGPLLREQIVRTVGEVLGENALEDVHVADVRGRRIVLEVLSSAQAFEWEAFHKEALLCAFRENPSLAKYTDLRIRVGVWKKS